jgi:hypothetical protein
VVFYSVALWARVEQTAIHAEARTPNHDRSRTKHDCRKPSTLQGLKEASLKKDLLLPLVLIGRWLAKLNVN